MRSGLIIATMPFAAGSPPTLSSVVVASASIGDVDGGYSATLTGTHFTGATGVTFGGTAATSVVVASPTSITCTVPAHASGAVSVIVTTPGGTNAANTLWTYASLADYYFSGLWMSDFSGAPWAATASAGVSGTTGDLVNGVSPATSASQGGHTGPDFNGTTQYLVNATDATTLYSHKDATILALVWIDAADAASGNTYDDAAIIVDGNADIGLTVAANGGNVDITGFAYDGAYRTKTVTVTTGAYHLVMMRTDADGTLLGMTVDSVAETTRACGTKTSMTGVVTVGQGYGGAHELDGRLLLLGTSTFDLSANYATFKAICNSKFGLAL